MADRTTTETQQDTPSVVGPEVSAESSKGQLVPMEVQSPDAIRPIRPEFITDERDAEIRAAATQLVVAVLENPSDVNITSSLYGLGKPAMDANTQHVGLMDTKIGTVMQTVTVENPVAKGLTEIKAKLDLVNPHVVAETEGEFKDKVFGLIPWVVRRLPKAEEVMVLINERRDTVATTVETLQQHLWSERDKALANAVQLSQIANRLFETQEDLQEATYQGQLIWEQLNTARAGETDPVRTKALTHLVNDLSTLVIDLQTVDQLNIQSRMGAEDLINNCRQIEKLVHRVTNILLPAVRNALAVRAAAVQQAQLVGAANSIMDAAGKTLRQTAADVRQTTTATAKMNTEAMVKIEDLEAACREYEQAQEELFEIFTQAEQKARGVSNTLSDMNTRMRAHADPLTQARLAKEKAGV